MPPQEYLTDEEYFSQQHVASQAQGEDADSLFRQARDLVTEAIKSSGIEKAKIANAGPDVTDQVQRIAREVYLKFNEQALARHTAQLPMTPEEFVRQIEYSILGMGPLEPLLRDPEVEDIVINGIREVIAYRHGRWTPSDVRFASELDLIELLNRGMAGSGHKINPTSPIADAELPGGQRISVAMDPISRFPVASIRCPRAHDVTFPEMVAQQVLTPAAADYLSAAIRVGLNIVFVGATGSGKTTMINAAGRVLKTHPATRDYRVIVIENTREISILPQTDLPTNIVYLCSRPESLDKKIPAVPEDALVRLSLRQRPDALTLGEARGEEILPLLQALSTGHKNGMTSIHANSIEESFDRILIMLNMSEQGRKLSERRVAKLVSLAFNVLVFIRKDPSLPVGRSVQTIAEFTGRVEESQGIPYPELRIIFDRQEGALKGPQNPTVHAGRFRDEGVDPAPFLGTGGGAP
jgi:Flp pilus assembly CpaF family ATPase